MKNKKLNRLITLVAAGISANLVLIPSLLAENVKFVPPQGSQPTQTSGGATRGNICAQEAIVNPDKITLLVPGINQNLTTDARPTLLAYVPQTGAEKALLVIKDEQENNLYQTELPITGEAGIVSVIIPDDAPELEVGKTYKWSFVVMCNNQILPDSPGAEGQIQRVELDAAVSSQLEPGISMKNATLLGESGIWYDTVATLAELKKANPSDATINTEWENLLTSVGLEEIATKPLAQ
ncbi:MAG: DUF928 domain-containing protein [Gomphosphaeria aponina SAG 52.96 = DSM 107014]|uniref:DUF928 domain-containing protein n=1 Tax=Gomphosphaeria aponina SAG 52.96 = DSM 107014 TaxID=1521640 RepID=A0A941GWM6_9CHRO|nr:DUF928 domain-containing protein [Gomphosphaeria aponina SAG 52.96 = DSM 107014]